MDDVTKKLEALEKRIKELESKQKTNQQMFGRSYSQAGDSNSDFLIKTKGQVKIQWGSKFIDLIKDGKINVDAKFIYKGSVGSKDGIYVDGENVFLKVGDLKPINLIGEIGTTYVSFLGEQETTSNQKYTAQKNIGLIANTLNDVNITSGLIYIESEGKLYLVNNGNIEELTLKFPNPFSEQFIISKNNSSQGALVIRGSGIENGIFLDGLYIYKNNSDLKITDQISISDQYSQFLNTIIPVETPATKLVIKIITITSIKLKVMLLSLFVSLILFINLSITFIFIFPFI